MPAPSSIESNSLLGKVGAGRDWSFSNKNKAPFNPNLNPNIFSFKKLLLMLIIVLVAVSIAKFVMRPVVATKQENMQVVAANYDIAPGSKLTFTSLHYTNIPKKYFNKEMFLSYEQLIGKTTSSFIRKADPIVSSSLFDKSKVSEILAHDKRAISLHLDPEFQVDHCLQFGDHVDLIATATSNSSKLPGKKYTRTICQNLTVLLATPKEMIYAPGARISNNNLITLAASPSDCEHITQAADTAKLRLVLRNSMSAENNTLTGSDERDILPHFALKEMAELAVEKISNLPLLPPPPPPATVSNDSNSSNNSSNIIEKPVQWVVEMFSGAKKENYAIPQH